MQFRRPVPTRRAVLGYAAAIAGSAGIPAARAASAGLRVRGRDLMRDGAPVLLRGVAVGDAVIARADRPISDYRVLAQGWRANTVRISMHPGQWRTERSTGLAALERETAAALGQGHQVILVWQAIGWPDGPYQRPDPEWQLPAHIYDSGLDLAADFWSAVSRRFGGEPRVIFELWNEPVHLEAPEGTSGWGEDWRELRPIWIELTGMIRRNADNLVVATGGSWASDLTGIRDDPLPDGNTAYAWHVYPGTAAGEPERLEQRLDALPRVCPVLVTEWGFSPDRDGHLKGDRDGFGDMFADRFLARYGLHWTAWCWHPHWQPPLIEADWRTPTEAGALALALLHERRPPSPNAANDG